MFTSRLNTSAPVTRDPAAVDTPEPGVRSAPWILFILAHIPLAFLMKSESLVAYAHGFTAFATGLWWALSTRQLHRVAWVMAYVIGSEVLWRMTTDALPWEAGKYMIVVLSAVALSNSCGLRSLVLPGLMFALLLPSAALTINATEYAVWRSDLSFNLSGPLALVLCAGFFAQTRLSPNQWLRLLLLLAGPIFGIAAIVLTSIMTAESITFTNESNFELSGGFGPNQVSLVLGLGALACLWGVLERNTRWPLRATLSVAVLWFAAQSALTFSRGGFLGALGAALVAAGFLVMVPQSRRQLLLITTFTVVVGSLVVWPMLLSFTGGRLQDRFEETDLTSREIYGRQDLKTWEDHPVLGVGPGRSSFGHSRGGITHTEFTRLLAEHGSFGAFAIFMMGVAFLVNIYRAPSAREKGLAASAMTWSLLYMSNAAMRTCAAAFIFGLGFCAFGSLQSSQQRARAVQRVRPERRTWAGLASRPARTRRERLVQSS